MRRSHAFVAAGLAVMALGVALTALSMKVGGALVATIGALAAITGIVGIVRLTPEERLQRIKMLCVDADRELSTLPRGTSVAHGLVLVRSVLEFCKVAIRSQEWQNTARGTWKNIQNKVGRSGPNDLAALEGCRGFLRKIDRELEPHHVDPTAKLPRSFAKWHAKYVKTAVADPQPEA